LVSSLFSVGAGGMEIHCRHVSLNAIVAAEFTVRLRRKCFDLQRRYVSSGHDGE